MYEYLCEIHAVFEHAVKSPSEAQGGLGLGEIIGPNLLTLSFKFLFPGRVGYIAAFSIALGTSHNLQVVVKVEIPLIINIYRYNNY